MCLVIDPDALLKKDLVTLDEALKTANNDVLLAINSISVLITDTQKRFLHVPNHSMKEVGVSKLMTIVESYKDAKIGFGTGYSIRASILQAMYDCPFLNVDIKDLNGVVICVLAKSEYTKEDEMNDFLHVFRQSTGYMKEIVISTICEPNLEPNLLVTTVIVLGVGFTFTQGIGGLQTFGKEKQMVKGASIHSLVTSSLGDSRMDFDKVPSFV